MKLKALTHRLSLRKSAQTNSLLTIIGGTRTCAIASYPSLLKGLSDISLLGGVEERYARYVTLIVWLALRRTAMVAGPWLLAERIISQFRGS